MVQESQAAGTFSGLAMASNAVATVILPPFLVGLLYLTANTQRWPLDQENVNVTFQEDQSRMRRLRTAAQLRLQCVTP